MSILFMCSCTMRQWREPCLSNLVCVVFLQPSGEEDPQELRVQTRLWAPFYSLLLRLRRRSRVWFFKRAAGPLLNKAALHAGLACVSGASSWQMRPSLALKHAKTLPGTLAHAVSGYVMLLGWSQIISLRLFLKGGCYCKSFDFWVSATSERHSGWSLRFSTGALTPLVLDFRHRLWGAGLLPGGLRSRLQRVLQGPQCEWSTVKPIAEPNNSVAMNSPSVVFVPTAHLHTEWSGQGEVQSVMTWEGTWSVKTWLCRDRRRLLIALFGIIIYSYLYCFSVWFQIDVTSGTVNNFKEYTCFCFTFFNRTFNLFTGMFCIYLESPA